MKDVGKIGAFADRLRTETRPAHRGLDHHPLLAPLIHASLSNAAYAAALSALHGPQQAIEAILAPVVPQTKFPPRLPDLERDLAILGISPCPLTVAMPQIQSEAQLIGVMYVIEGSNLGGAVIARQLETSLSATAPRDFFRNSGGTARWAMFWQFAQTFCQEDAFSDVTDAANQTFALYKAHLDQCHLTLCTTPTESFLRPRPT